MPDHRHHRGAGPEDRDLFGPNGVPPLQAATHDLSWLLSRDYASPGAVKVVGDRYNLTQRQRTAVMRAACPDQALASRREREVRSAPAVEVDGYNLLTTVEAALGGGVILACRDGTFRDMASMHGTYRKVEETLPALELIGRFMADAGIDRSLWYLDSPVSNSGRLKTCIMEMAQQHGWDWTIELVQNPDAVLSESKGIVVTADSVILDRCGPWINLARAIVEQRVPAAWVVDLG